MDVRSREAALKRRNDELNACQILCGDDSSALCTQDQDLSSLVSQENLEVEDTNCLAGENVAENGVRVNILFLLTCLFFT